LRAFGALLDHLIEVGLQRQREGRQDAIDLRREAERGRRTLDQLDVSPTARLDARACLGQHGVRQIDPDQPSFRPDPFLEQAEVQTRAAADLDDRIASL
jgi:hypothetical protein